MHFSIIMLLPVALALPMAAIQKRQEDGGSGGGGGGGGVGNYGQCGGQGYGPLGCDGGWSCVYQNEYYSQCLPPGVGFTKRETSAALNTRTASNKASKQRKKRGDDSDEGRTSDGDDDDDNSEGSDDDDGGSSMLSGQTCDGPEHSNGCEAGHSCVDQGSDGNMCVKKRNALESKESKRHEKSKRQDGSEGGGNSGGGGGGGGGGEAGEYGQCGGQGWGIGCSGGWSCVYQNAWYSQCLPPGVGFTKRETGLPAAVAAKH